MPKTTAVAFPIQGLIKYHGLRDFDLRIPYHDSISVCTAPTETRTTVEFSQAAGDSVQIDGTMVEGRERERVLKVVDAVRRLARTDRRIKMVSKSNFPKYVGLGSSASGFAALALAASRSLDLTLDAAAVSELARLGAGSASRAVTGGFSEWVTEAKRSYARCLAKPGDVPWTTIAVVTPHEVPTEGVHRDAMQSPFFQARLAYLPAVLDRMRRALRERDALRVMELAEQDTLNLHAVTMTSPQGLVAWRGVTVEVIHRVRALRKARIPCYFSIDTGAAVYVNTLPEHADEVEEGLRDVAGRTPLMRLEVGSEAHTVPDHFF